MQSGAIMFLFLWTRAHPSSPISNTYPNSQYSKAASSLYLKSFLRCAKSLSMHCGGIDLPDVSREIERERESERSRERDRERERKKASEPRVCMLVSEDFIGRAPFGAEMNNGRQRLNRSQIVGKQKRRGRSHSNPQKLLSGILRTRLSQRKPVMRMRRVEKQAVRFPHNQRSTSPNKNVADCIDSAD